MANRRTACWVKIVSRNVLETCVEIFRGRRVAGAKRVGSLTPPASAPSKPLSARFRRLMRCTFLTFPCVKCTFPNA